MGRKINDAEFDSNCITPGTEWMAKLSIELDLFVKKQMSENAHWKRLSVIYSDHLTPGEGEHKIMEYIRNMKSQPNYNPNTRFYFLLCIFFCTLFCQFVCEKVAFIFFFFLLKKSDKFHLFFLKIFEMFTHFQIKKKTNKKKMCLGIVCMAWTLI